MAIPSFNDLQKYDVNLYDQKEGVTQSLYDFQAAASAGQTQLSFFQLPVGQSSKTLADTNMQAAGQLPAGQAFLIQNVQIFFFPGVTVDSFAAANAATPKMGDDVYAMLKSGWLDLVIGSKSYLKEGPIGRFPPKSGMSAVAAVSTNSTTTGVNLYDYATFAGSIYELDAPLTLRPNQNFSVTLNWPTAVSLPSGQAGRIGVVLGGVLYRNSQ